MVTVSVKRIEDDYDVETVYETAIDVVEYQQSIQRTWFSIEDVECCFVLKESVRESSFLAENEASGTYGPHRIVSEDQVKDIDLYKALIIGREHHHGYSILNIDEMRPAPLDLLEFIERLCVLQEGANVSMVVPSQVYRLVSRYRTEQALMDIYEKHIPGFNRYDDW